MLKKSNFKPSLSFKNTIAFFFVLLSATAWFLGTLYTFTYEAESLSLYIDPTLFGIICCVLPSSMIFITSVFILLFGKKNPMLPILPLSIVFAYMAFYFTNLLQHVIFSKYFPEEVMYSFSFGVCLFMFAELAVFVTYLVIWKMKYPFLISSIFFLIVNFSMTTYYLTDESSPMLSFEWLSALLLSIALVIFSTGKKVVYDMYFPHSGRLSNKKNCLICIILSVLTLGIYTFLWKYSLCLKTRRLYSKNIDCRGEFLLFALVPFYNIYWFITKEKKVLDATGKFGITSPDRTTLYIILAFFGLEIIAMAFMQKDMNLIAQKYNDLLLKKEASEKNAEPEL